jgi:hypothetical protein
MSREWWKLLMVLCSPLFLLGYLLVFLGKLPENLRQLGKRVARPWAVCRMKANGWVVVGPTVVNNQSLQKGRKKFRRG